MKNFKLFFLLFLFLAVFATNKNASAQSQPVLYFCEDYTSDGEQNVSDVFTTGWLTVMVKSDDGIGYENVSIDLLSYNQYSDNFEFYKSVPFSITPSMKYVYFKDEEKLKFSAPGFYRVQLTANNGNKVIASAIIRIINR